MYYNLNTNISQFLLYNIFMIEFLSNESWINPQIDFLLCLQNFRLQHSDLLNRLFLSITAIGEFWLPTMICAICYWCINSRNGIYLFSIFGMNLMLSQLFKMLACVYRPWVLSDKIKPVEAAMAFTKGYSFPSGHSSMAASVIGGLAFILRKNIFMVSIFIFLILMVGFSRLWLGVHTPQDVITGLLTGLILVFVINLIVNWMDKDKNRYLYMLIAINLFAAIALIYICYFNKFPLDYINGELLVNPKNSIRSTIICYGYSLGIINGILVCRRFFPFDAGIGNIKSKLLRGILGLGLISILLNFPVEFCFKSHCSCKIIFAIPLIIGFFITGIYPLIFSKIKFLYYNNDHGNN